MKSTWPPTRSVIAGVPPLYGTCTALRLYCRLMYSPMMCDDAPLPTEAKRQRLGLAGLERSSTVLYGELADTASTFFVRASIAMGVTSLARSYFSLREERLVGAVRLAVADGERVAVGRRGDALAGADGAGRARLVLDDDRLAAPHRTHLRGRRDARRRRCCRPAGRPRSGGSACRDRCPARAPRVRPARRGDREGGNESGAPEARDRVGGRHHFGSFQEERTDCGISMRRRASSMSAGDTCWAMTTITP